MQTSDGKIHEFSAEEYEKLKKFFNGESDEDVKVGGVSFFSGKNRHERRRDAALRRKYGSMQEDTDANDTV